MLKFSKLVQLSKMSVMYNYIHVHLYIFMLRVCVITLMCVALNNLVTWLINHI